MKYILIVCLIIGCSNPLSSEKHPNENAKDQCYKCHEIIYIID